jgi:hypothetical protein
MPDNLGKELKGTHVFAARGLTALEESVVWAVKGLTS